MVRLLAPLIDCGDTNKLTGIGMLFYTTCNRKGLYRQAEKEGKTYRPSVWKGGGAKEPVCR